MKILLLQPPVQDFYDTDVRLQPIGLCYLKSQAAKYHPDVEVLVRDYHQGHGKKSISVPKELQYLKRYWAQPDQSPFCGFYHYYHFGLSFEKILAEIQAINPDVIGISSLFSPYYREVLNIAELVKQWRPTLPILLGGSHVNAMPRQMLSSAFVDYVILGEGERGFVEFIDYLKGEKALTEVANLGHKKNGELYFNPEKANYSMDEICFPDFSDLNQANYLFAGKPMCFMVTSRSCPHKCSFCSVHQTFGNNYRRRCVQNVFAEIQLRVQEGYRIIDFEDDNLTFYKAEMKQLCQLIIDHFEPGTVEFVAMNGISYLSLDDELMQLMKRAGFTHLNLALVSSDKLVREATKRPHTVEKYLQVIDQAQKLEFQITSYQILGLPQETLDSMIQTLCFGAGLPVLLGASLFYMTPNSPIARQYQPDPQALDVFLSRLTAMAIETEHASRSQLYTLFITTRIINFIKSFAYTDNQGLKELLSKKSQDKKIQLGLNQLSGLFQQRQLFFATNQGMILNENFDAELFLRIWEQIPFISNRQGQRLLNSLI